VRQNDTASDLHAVLRDADGAAVDIQGIAGSAIKFRMGPLEGGTLIVSDQNSVNDQVGDGSDGSKGRVHYSWVPADTDTDGLYLGTFRVTFAGAEVQSFPNGGFVLVRLTLDLPHPAVAPFTTTLDLEDRLGLVLTSDEHQRGQRLLLRATELIRRQARQHISLVTGDVLLTSGSWGDRLRLPERPVVSVALVEVDGVTVPATDYHLEGDELVRLTAWGGPQAAVEVTYTHGYAEIPGEIQQVALECVTRIWVNPGSVQSETSGAQTVGYAHAGLGMLLTVEEKQTLAQLVGRKMGSVQMR
jgi:hypothetical protein